MESNQVGSINFDANALYLEEESENELDDKQQDNELKELISQGGLDGILDDDSSLNSSADSSYDESDTSEANTNNQNMMHTHHQQPQQQHHANINGHHNHRQLYLQQHNEEILNKNNNNNNKLDNHQLIENGTNNGYPLASIENNQIYMNENVPQNHLNHHLNHVNHLNHHHHHQQQILGDKLEMNVNPTNENDANLYHTASASSSPSSNNIQINNMPNTPALQIQKSNFTGNDFRNPTQLQSNNHILVNQFSTPATNQPPPSHQLLQATLIPTISEDKQFFRQRAGMPPPPGPPLQPQQLQTPLNQQILPQMQMQVPNYTNSNDNDQTIQTIANENELGSENGENNHYAHYLPPPQPHKKLNTMEIFAFNVGQQQPQQTLGGEISSTTSSTTSSSSSSATNLIAHQLPQPQRLIPHHHDHHGHHLANDPDLSLNDTDNEDDENLPRGELNGAVATKIIPHQLVKMDFNPVNVDNNENKETSLVDLNELDEAQLKQLQQEEEKQQQEYFNIDHLNRLYCQAQFLYKVRGKKLEEVTNRFTAYQEDMTREIRAMKHRVFLAEKEKESLQTSVNQSHELCTQYKSETEQAKKACSEWQEKFDKLKQTNRLLEQKLTETEQDVESLQSQIAEQQKLDSLERVQEQHEQFIQQMRDQYEKDIYQLKEKCNETQKELNEKHEFIHMLRVQLETATKNAEMASVERADTITRLTKSLNDLQTKYDQDIIIANLNNNNTKLTNQQANVSYEALNEKTKIIEKLTEKCTTLEEELGLYEALKLANQAVTSNTTNESVVNTLQRELERSLTSIKQKRNEIQKIQLDQQKYVEEIEKLKRDLSSSNLHTAKCDKCEHLGDLTNIGASASSPYQLSLKNDIDRLNNLVDELQKEKDDLTNDLSEKNSKLDLMFEQEEQFQQVKNNLELELFSKQQHINECEKLIEQLHANSNQENIQMQFHQQQQQQQMILNEYEAQISELKLNLTNREHEVQKVREMYIEVCNDKNNLQDTLKEQYDTEYEKKLKHKVDLAVSNKLEEQKNYLTDKWSQERRVLMDDYKKKLDISIVELKSLKETLNETQKSCEQLKQEKTNLEIKSTKVESELEEKCMNLENAIKNNEENFRNDKTSHAFQLESLRKELDDARKSFNEQKEQLEYQLAQSEKNFNDLKSEYDFEKQKFVNLIGTANKENETLQALNQNLNKKLELESVKLIESESSKVKELESKLIKVQLNLNECELKLNANQIELSEIEVKLQNEQEKFKTTSSKWELETNQLNQNLISLTNEYDKLGQLKKNLEIKVNQQENECIKLKEFNEQVNAKCAQELNEKLEVQKQNWNQERNLLISKKDEELQKLEKRFEEDYSKFMQTHKDSMHRTLNEKSQEHAKEKENLIELYQNKFNDYETREQTLSKQIKELKERINSQAKTKLTFVDVKVQTDQMVDSKTLENSKNRDEEEAAAEEHEKEQNEYIESLHNKISSLEDVLSNTDAHFELELEKLRQELEDEYQVKLKYELEKEESHQKQLEQELDNLRYQLEQKSSFNNDEDDPNCDDLSSSLVFSNKNNVRQKYAKLKNDLNTKEKEMESVEQTYRFKMDQIQGKFDEHLRQMKNKYEIDLHRAKLELNDNYKQALNKSKHEIEQIQAHVIKLKKSNTDSDKVIESYKLEMNKMTELHLNELTSLKMNSERDKQRLKENLDEVTKRCELYEQQLFESEDYLKKQCDLLRNELKLQYGNELSRLNIKMKEMMKSHADSIEQLKRQHQTTRMGNTRGISCQTDTTCKDIDLLDAFKQKYLDTLSRMKSDMMKEYDAQTLRVSEKVSRQLNEERVSLKEKVHAVLMPKMIDALREYKVNETIIRMKMKELENDLNQIVIISEFSKRPSSASTVLGSQTNTKRSVSALNTVRPSPTKNNEVSSGNFQLYSKSASSMKEVTGSIKSLINDEETNFGLNKPNIKSGSNTISGAATSLGVHLSTGYKYTPLRQSWSNLTQMNSLSPYSNSSNLSENSTNRKTLFEESNGLNEEYRDRIAENLSPSIPRTTRKITTNRPLTAESVLSRSSSTSKTSSDFGLLPTNKELDTKNEKNVSDEDDDDETTATSVFNNNDKDYVYYDDDTDDVSTNDASGRNNFYKKNRAQNIRYKKTTPKILQTQARPHSASILIRNHTESHKSSMLNENQVKENPLYSPSTGSLSGKNPIDTLYEMSKNYKTIETSGKSTYLTRSNTDISSDPFNRRYQLSTDMDKMKPKTNLSIYKKTSSNFIHENDDETPMRLSDINDIEDVSSSSTNQIYEPAEAYKDPKSTAKNDTEQSTNNSTNQKKNSNTEVRRAVTIIRNPSLKSSSTTSTSTAPNANASNSNTLTFNSNSLPRARTPTSNLTNNELSTNSSKSYRPTTVSGTNAILHNQQQHVSNLSTTSTQYHPIANNLTNNLVKNSTLTKKKPVFY